MKEQSVKAYPKIGCCGHDCGLCPRYHTKGKIKCAGCCGPDFFQRHPSCGFITCCVHERGLEVCSQCPQFPCAKTKEYENILDSFVSHKRAHSNLKLIKEHGIEPFLEQQNKRLELLRKMTKGFDDGGSESFFYVAATLLPLADLETALQNAEKQLEIDNIAPADVMSKALILKSFLNDVAQREGIELKLGSKRT